MRRATRLLITLGTALMLLISCGTAGAEGESKAGPFLGSDTRISGVKATFDEHTPAVAWNQTADEYLVVWQDWRNAATTGADIYGRRVGTDGIPIGPDIRITGPGATLNQNAPAVAWNQGTNEYLVVWEDWRDSATRGSDIYGRRVAADGKPIGNERRLCGPNATAGDYTPAVAWSQASNRYVVVWQDGRNFASRIMDIYARQVGADGKPIGGDRRISGRNALADEHEPAIAWNGAADEFLVVWRDGRNPATAYDIYGRRVGPDAKPIGGERRVSSRRADAADQHPAVAWNAADDEYLVVWQDGRNAATRSWDIYGRRVGADGRPQGGDRRISGSRATADEQMPAIAYGQTSGQYLVMWRDGRNNPTRADDIYGRWIGGDAKPVAGDFRICGKKAYFQESEPAVAWDATNDEFLVVWTDSRNTGTRCRDIYGRWVEG